MTSTLSQSAPYFGLHRFPLSSATFEEMIPNQSLFRFPVTPFSARASYITSPFMRTSSTELLIKYSMVALISLMAGLLGMRGELTLLLVWLI